MLTFTGARHTYRARRRQHDLLLLRELFHYIGFALRRHAIIHVQQHVDGDTTGLDTDRHLLQQRLERASALRRLHAQHVAVQMRLYYTQQGLFQAPTLARRPVVEFIATGNRDAAQKRSLVPPHRVGRVVAIHRVEKEVTITGQVGAHTQDGVFTRDKAVAEQFAEAPESLTDIVSRAIGGRVGPEQRREGVARVFALPCARTIGQHRQRLAAL